MRGDVCGAIGSDIGDDDGRFAFVFGDSRGVPMGKTLGFRVDSRAIEQCKRRFLQCFGWVMRLATRKNKGVSRAKQGHPAWKAGKMPMISEFFEVIPPQKHRGFAPPWLASGTETGGNPNVFGNEKRYRRAKTKGFSMLLGVKGGQNRAKVQCF